MSPID